MVSPNKSHAFRVTNLEGKEKKERLHAVEAAVNEIACQVFVSAIVDTDVNSENSCGKKCFRQKLKR